MSDLQRPGTLTTTDVSLLLGVPAVEVRRLRHINRLATCGGTPRKPLHAVSDVYRLQKELAEEKAAATTTT